MLREFYQCVAALSFGVAMLYNFKLKNFTIMKERKRKLASTAKKSATIIAMAGIVGASISSMSKAERAAMHDIEKEYGRDCVIADYTWDPFDGLLA